MTEAPNIVACRRAISLIGRQYRLYGTFTSDQRSAGDCSSLTQYAYHGLLERDLTHHAATQAEETHPVYHGDIDPLRPGDLAFYRLPIDHVTIYIGHGSELHRLWGIDPERWGIQDDWRAVVSASYPDAYGLGHGVGISRLMMYSSETWKPVRYGRPYYQGWKTK